MPPGRRGRRGAGFAGASGAGRGNPDFRLLGKRKGGPEIGEDDEDFNTKPGPPGTNEKQTKRMYENQSSFANFMNKRGEVINRFLDEKAIVPFKSPEWMEKRLTHKKVHSKHVKNLKQILSNEPYPDAYGSYQSIDGGISVKKSVKYCDFTGFHAPYQDPKTGIRYYGSEFYPIVRNLPDGVKDEYLAIRKANIILK